VPPDRFIPVAEDSGMIIELGTWVLEQACRQMGEWKQSALDDVTISINVSAWQLAAPDFVTLVSQALMRNKLAPHQLELELTERVLIEDAANVQAVLAQLRALGVGISLDDFGTGYSSLSYLTQFHLNTLKIDRAFVMDIEHSERSNSLGRPSSRWGTASGCNWWRRAWRRPGRRPSQKMGCHYLQGYHIARPAAPDELLRFADERAGAGAAHRLRYLAVGTFCAASSAVRIQMRSILPMLSTCSSPPGPCRARLPASRCGYLG
jgi:EAL domain-containing protein (putative c-di-GMP-specific phosphodiesterase class I)